MRIRPRRSHHDDAALKPPEPSEPAPLTLTPEERRAGWHISQLGKVRTMPPSDDADDDDGRALTEFDPFADHFSKGTISRTGGQT